MTATIAALYRRLDLAQQRRGVRIALSIIALLIATAIAVPAVSAGASYARVRQSLLRTIDGASLAKQDAAAIELRDRGTITVGDRSYGSSAVRDLGDLLFDAAGEVNAPDRLVDLMLADQRPAWLPEFLLEQEGTALLVGLVALAWLQFIVWLGLTVPFVLVLLGTALVATPFWLAGSAAGTVSVAGIGLLTFSFVLLIRLVLITLRGNLHAFAVAHTVVKEAVRLNISLGFIIVLLVALPLIPLWIDADQPLRYQVQTFISRSLSLTYVAAACMTLLLACATVSFEIRDRQIWQLLTKPIGRFQYLLGKFIGVAALNLVLLIISGISIFVFVQHLRTRPAKDLFDAAAVRDEVLVARSSALAKFDVIPRDELIARVDATIGSDPIMLAEIASGQRTEADVRRQLAVQYQTEYLAKQRMVPPGEKRAYVFSGLSRAKSRGAPLTLRYTFYVGKQDSHEVHPVMFEFDGFDKVIYKQYVPVQGHVITVPNSVVRDDGTVEVTIYNSGYDEGSSQFYPARWAIHFDAKDFELLYKVSDFEWNFLRAMTVFWIKLAFLAMLGVSAATFLSFPVACILSFTLFLIGSMAPFIAESLEYWAVDGMGRVDQWFVKGIASASEWTLRSFGSLRPTEALVEGRLISVSEVLVAAGTIGVFWCGAALLIGWLAFRRKEIAIYSGQG